MGTGMLADQVIVISGVGPGLGRKLALQCAEQGARLVLGARSGDFIASVAEEIVRNGEQAHAVPTDVSKAADCDHLITESVARFGRIDGLVNSAFRFETSRFEEADLGRWREAMDVACFGSLKLAQAALPHLKASRGSIVNVSTIGSRIGTEGSGGYNLSKAALNMATRQLARELGPDGIRVNGALMGWMAGEPLKQGFAARAAARGISPDVLERELMDTIPLRRIPTDDECAGAVIFLLSGLASACTGVLLDVNGGMFMAG
ncbi:putative oxidoreductase [Caenibius tardaugens NBRC 16725]|uniref:Putative oxidoreductase n=1 Tax=Caenibius tardaugens NBRC 16725 TaxID=1219035 RepID=U2YMV7_9SPHN|nr:SDR family oxidoreductase [Caenibius tardaugens]GAD49817.1 putative oxidoreductase [Caenibius tardaugens NBRC 16725]